MSGVHIRKRITFFGQLFFRVLEEWDSAAVPYKRTQAQQRLHTVELIVHIFAVNKGAQSLEHPR